MSATELVVQVDENDLVLGGVPRTDAHSDKRILHREVDVFLVNSYGLLLIKRKSPEKWCHVGGHPDYIAELGLAEGWTDAALREFEEEVGYRLGPQDIRELRCSCNSFFIRRTETKFRINHRLERVYLSQKEIAVEDFKPNPAEVLDIRYFKMPDLDVILRDENQLMAGTRHILTVETPMIYGRIPAR